MAYTLIHHPTDHQEARIMVRVDGIGGQFNLSHPHPCWIGDLKVIEVWCQQLLQCLCIWTSPKAHGIPNMADDIGRLEPT